MASGYEALPLGQCGRVAFLLGLAIDEVAFLVDPKGGEANWLWTLAWTEANFGGSSFA